MYRTRCVLAFLLLLIRMAVAGSEQPYFSYTEMHYPIPDDPVAQAIVSRALMDGIDLSAFAFSGPALQEIVFWSHFEVPPEILSLSQRAEGARAIDVHGSSSLLCYESEN
jgi:hypothetical protein